MLIVTKVICDTFDSRSQIKISMKAGVLIILFFLPVLMSTLVFGQKSKMSQSFIGDVISHRAGPATFSMKLRS